MTKDIPVFIRMSKIAYPNMVDSLPQRHPYDTDRWLEQYRAIKVRENCGMEHDKAFALITKGWGENETLDFGYWINYYEEQAQMKYKSAQMYGHEGYYLPIKSKVPDPIPMSEQAHGPASSQRDINNSSDSGAAESKAAEQAAAKARKEEIELHRKKIIARLTSARKLLTDDNG